MQRRHTNSYFRMFRLYMRHLVSALSLPLSQLQHEARVWIDIRPHVLQALIRLCQSHPALSHYEGHHYSRRPTHSHCAVHKYVTMLQSLGNEVQHTREVSVYLYHRHVFESDTHVAVADVPCCEVVDAVFCADSQNCVYFAFVTDCFVASCSRT